MHRGGLTNILLIILAISLLLDWYVFNGLKTLTAGWRSDRWRQAVRWGWLIFSLGITLVFLLGLGSFRTAKGMTPFHEWMLSLFLTLVITKIFFGVILLLGDLGRFFYGVIHHIVQPARRTREPFFPARR